MKVYLLIPSHGHDGWGQPLGIYSTLALAQAAQATYDKSRCYYRTFGSEIWEAEIDGLIKELTEAATSSTAE